MDPQRWTRVRELFATALERAPEGREAYVRQAGDRDAELAEEVRVLLAAHGESEGFLELPEGVGLLAEEKRVEVEEARAISASGPSARPWRRSSRS
jgi:hypothetical protein